MSWLIVGTVPKEDFPLYQGPCELNAGFLHLKGLAAPVARGTPALLATACLASRILGSDAPEALLVGDTGRGAGSLRIYRHHFERIDDLPTDLLVFHYLQPDVDWHNRIYWKLEERSKRPLLVADAGYMYVAKMSGFASAYDLFTPDVGEMAFLADETAPHPFYTRGFLLQEEERVPELILRAYQHENAARHLLVKGRCDRVASKDGVLETICEPDVEAMEPIGGTGDSLTGLVAALLAAGFPMLKACALAARINRMMGLLANPTPASSIADLLHFLPKAMEKVLSA
jgi:hypothetical protein